MSNGQVQIWRHFQTENSEIFSGNRPRLEFIFNHLKRYLKNSAEVHVLNIGPGNGYFEQLCQKAKLKVTCVDPDEQTVQMMKERSFDSVQAKIEKLPFDSEAFDFIVASEVLEHLPVLELSELKRVLKTGGVFFGTVPYQEKLEDNMVVCPHCTEKFHRWGHHQSFDESKLKAALSQVGSVAKMSVRSFVDWRRSGLLGKLKSLAKFLLGAFGSPVASPHFYFEVRK